MGDTRYLRVYKPHANNIVGVGDTWYLRVYKPHIVGDTWYCKGIQTTYRQYSGRYMILKGIQTI